MINHTQSYTLLKNEQQTIMDFAILICYAVPNLNKTINGIKKKVPNYGLANPEVVEPEYFAGKEPINRLVLHPLNN